MRKSKIFEVFEDNQGKRIYTKNLIKGNPVYGERIVRDQGVEYREWDPTRSKLAAMIMKRALNIGIRKGDVVLYLGAASGTTVSHVSDIVGENGWVFSLDFSSRVVRDLVFVAEKRKNIIPILGDATQPLSYANKVVQADILYQDVAQRNQAEIFIKNCRIFLKKGGYGLLAVKAKSVDISQKPKNIYKMVREELDKVLIVVDYKELDSFEKDHCMFIVKKK